MFGGILFVTTFPAGIPGVEFPVGSTGFVENSGGRLAFAVFAFALAVVFDVEVEPHAAANATMDSNKIIMILDI